MLRAAIVVGHGGISWELTRQLVKNLPAMVVPKWASTRTQPIAIDDVVRYLVGVADKEAALGKVFEIGGPDQLTYVDMLRVAAEADRGRSPLIVQVPVLTPRLSSYWLALVTDVDITTGRNLIDSMGTEVVVREHCDPRRRTRGAADVRRVGEAGAGRAGRGRGLSVAPQSRIAGRA